uniref:Major sperm protein n=1 Tax=Caenorhabditis japonica TaxID=281687 RepID=A0A8R1DZA6_CAEJA
MFQKTQLEDTIRELNRRLSAKTEDTGGDWESKKLKLRNEQVLTISRQMHAVVSQNEELREEIDRVSAALEDATSIIEQSASRFTELTTKLELSQLRVEELYQQNRRLTQVLPEELVEHVNRCVAAAETVASGNPADRVHYLVEVAELLGKQFMNDDEWKLVDEEMGEADLQRHREEISTARNTIHQLQEELAVLAEESNRLRAMVREDRTGEREAELEQLRTELVEATTLARNLFGQAMADIDEQDPTSALRMRILQLEHSVEVLSGDKEKLARTIEELQYTIEQKDEQNGEVLGQLNRWKDATFGSGREENARLEKQLQFRDEQIGKLQQHCTLLQVELGRYAEGSYKPIVKPKPRRVIQRADKLLIMDKPSPRLEDVPSKPQKPSPRVQEDHESPKKTRKRSEDLTNDYSEVAQQAVLISNLYYEMMQLLEEISYKDEKLQEMSTSWKSTQKTYHEMKAQLEFAYLEIRELKKENLTVEERTLNELKEQESVELRRLVESINVGGSELERRMGEATRMLVTERIERMRSTRQCTILKTKLDRLQNAFHRTRDEMRHQEITSQRQTTRLRYDVDSATIEIGRLQTRLLQSVPAEEHNNLMRKYKKLMKETCGVETVNAEMPSRPNLSVLVKNPAEAEVEAKENMLKKMIDVVSDQSDFWNQEASMLQSENEELKKFIEDVENESDLKSVLGAVERRLLATIRELRENEREYVREKRRQRGADGEAVRDGERLRQERLALLNVINVLQRENQTLRDQTMGTISLQQLEVFRSKIFAAGQQEAEISAKMEQLEKIQEETETEKLRVRAIRTTSELLSPDYESPNETPYNNEISKEQLQMALFNSSQQSAKAKQLERLVHLKEQRVTEMGEEVRELKKWNLELITALEGVKDFGRGESMSHQKKLEAEAPRPQEIQIPALNLQNSPDKESDYEMDIRSELSSSNSSSSSTGDRIIVRTIVQDNVDAFENRIKEIKASAQLAVQGYKEQLELKEIAIGRYKQMLREKIDEGVQIIEKVEIVHQEVEVPDRESELKLQKSEEKVKRLEADIERMRRTVQTSENLEHHLEEPAREFQEVEVQTEAVQTARTSSPPHSEVSRSSSRRLNNANEDGDVRSVKSVKSTAKSERMKEEMQLMQELVAKSDSKDGENLRQKAEIRDLKGRIQRLTRANKELMITCEQIKNDALAELSTFRRNNESSDEQRMTDLRIDLERLRSVNRTLKITNEELKVELTRVKQLVEKKSAKNEPDEWEKRKRQEEVITSLRDRLKKRETIEKDFLEKLEKRDRLIDTMRNDQGLRSAEIERLQRKLKANDPSTIKLQASKEYKSKIEILESNITKKTEEITTLNRQITRIQSDLEKVNLRHQREIEKVHVENRKLLREQVQIEVQKAREETKMAMRVIRPVLYSREVQTERKSSSSSSSRISTPPKSTSRSRIRAQEEPKSDRSDYYQLKESLQMTQDRLIESQERLIQMERDYTSLYEKFDRIRARIDRDERPTGAVLVLSDKLAAKDREIAQLKLQIAHLQRTIHLPF